MGKKHQNKNYTQMIKELEKAGYRVERLIPLTWKSLAWTFVEALVLAIIAEAVFGSRNKEEE